jgi:hypothetical protein
MNPRTFAASSIALASAAGLLTQGLSYALVYPARAQGSKLVVVLSLVAGGLLTAFAGFLSIHARRRSSLESERFLALIGIVLSAFLLFLIAFGFGIPSLVHTLRD